MNESVHLHEANAGLRLPASTYDHSQLAIPRKSFKPSRQQDPLASSLSSSLRSLVLAYDQSHVAYLYARSGTVACADSLPTWDIATSCRCLGRSTVPGLSH